MEFFKTHKNSIIITLIILVSALTRLVPHLPNFTPITAIALFGGVYFTNKITAYALPLVIMVLSDFILGFSSITIFVYLAFIVVSFIGTQQKKVSIGSVLLGGLSFFVITNFGVWLLGYPKTWTGLAECYTLALPFFRNSILGDLFYSGVMVFGYQYIQKYYLNKAV